MNDLDKFNQECAEHPLVWSLYVGLFIFVFLLAVFGVFTFKEDTSSAAIFLLNIVTYAGILAAIVMIYGFWYPGSGFRRSVYVLCLIALIFAIIVVSIAEPYKTPEEKALLERIDKLEAEVSVKIK